MVIKEYIQLLIPWLLVALLLFSMVSWTSIGQGRKLWQKMAVLGLAAIISLVPFTGLSLAEYLLSLNPNFSMGSLALAVVFLWPKLFDTSLLSEKTLFIFCLWNVLFSLILFSSYLGMIPYDIYSLGYSFSVGFIIMALITLVTIWQWPSLSSIFIAYIAAFNLRLLPSPNFFDYITDGFLFLMSLGLLFALAVPARRPIMPQH